MVSHSEVVEGAGLEVRVEQELSGVGVDVFPDDPCPHLHVLHQTPTLRETPPSFPETQKKFITGLIQASSCKIQGLFKDFKDFATVLKD